MSWTEGMRRGGGWIERDEVRRRSWVDRGVRRGAG